MKMKKQVRIFSQIVLVLSAVVLMTMPSFAAVFNLRADETTVTMPDGAIITVWGFALDAGPVTVPGPFLEVPPGDTTLTINFTNNLSMPVSIVIPGLPAPLTPNRFTDAQGRRRVRSFTTVTPVRGTNTYTWNELKPGTYIYHSGTHIALQVHMGLYGGMKIDAAYGQAYPGVHYDNEVILFYSEIDTLLHDPDSVPAQPLNYKPDYFLINGQPYPNSMPIVDHPITAGELVLVRFLNMGLKTHIPSFLGGYVSVIAEDGFPYTYPKSQYSILLPAGKTIDVLWTAPDTEGDYPVYDRSHFLRNAEIFPGGMLTYLTVDAGGPPPTDTVNILGALYLSGGRLRVVATTSAPPGTVTLTAIAHYGAAQVTLGTLNYRARSNDYRRNFTVAIPDMVTVTSTGGGTDTKPVPFQ